MAEVDERKALTRVSQAMRNLLTGARVGAGQSSSPPPEGQLLEPPQAPQVTPPPEPPLEG